MSNFNNSSTDHIPFRACQYPITVLDFQPPLNFSDSSKIEHDFPCEVRIFWMSIHLFVDIVQALLFYGTSVTIVLGVILNTLSFYVLLSSGLASNGSGIYLLVLAVCDSGNLIFNYAAGVARGHSLEINKLFQDNEWLCRFHGVFVEIFQLHSAWIVVGFTFERCLVVWYPMVLKKKRQFRSKILVTSLVIVFTLFALSKLFLTGFEKDSVFGYKACISKRYKWDGMAYVGVAFQTWIPTCLVFVFNCLMFYKLRHIKRNRNRLTGRNTRKRPAPDTRNQQSFLYRPSATTPMLITVSLAYLVLVFPLGVVQTAELQWNVQHKQRPTDKTLYIDWMMTKILLKYIRSFCFCLYQMNFSINFFLYFASGVQFRVHLLYKLSCLMNWLGISKGTTAEGAHHSGKSMTSHIHSSSVL